MALRLAALLDGLLPVDPLLADLEVNGLCLDSRRVSPGDLYVAIVGARFDGRDFAAQAIARGAVGVLGPAPTSATVAWPWLIHAEPRTLLVPLARRLFGAVEASLTLVGITGTNGKSTAVALTQAVLEATGRPAGILGTLGYFFAEKAYCTEVGRTTLEAPDLYRTLAEMTAAGAQAVAMEVASHALAQGRVDGLQFDVAAFTNLTRDHLDFHGSMEAYYAAKRPLFDRLKPHGRAVVHLADEWGRRLASELPNALAVGIDAGDVWAEKVHFALDGTHARIRTPRGPVDLEARLIGRYNLENLLTVMGIAEALELPHDAVAGALSVFPPINGRLEPVVEGQKFPALVDYAHTPAALEALLRSVREISPRRIVLVFGCGGERDKGKRPMMGKIAGDLADIPVITSDNPRREDPLAILVEVEKGLKESGNQAYRLVPDRHEAIQRAVRVAVRGEEAGDPCVVLVAGKGHEKVQDLGDRVIPFRDRDELQAAIRSELASSKASGAAKGLGTEPPMAGPSQNTSNTTAGERHG